ncbi:MAG TPA: VWA domain-containing protein [Anaerolineae bacterium]|nr:VWA domain-containing protein [Anaerolineae bacterium]
MSTDPLTNRRQAIYWRLLAAAFNHNDQGATLNHLAHEITAELGLPDLLLNPHTSLDDLLQRYPDLENQFHNIIPTPDNDTSPHTTDTLHRALLYSKLLLNLLGPNTQTNTVNAQQYAQWLRDKEHFSHACAPDDPNAAATPAADLQQALQKIEDDMIKRMALREILQDDHLAQQLTPSMPLVEQLLRDKANLSGKALAHAKRLIQQYINELADILRLQIQQAPAGKIDYTIPPKRTYRNLDLKRTLWSNLPNWNPNDQRLYVTRLYYRHTARKRLPTRLIVVVDQSGSMVDAMVQCTIIASIFAGLPHVDVHLLAFDTRVLDLTPWVADPFELLLRTQLGGGTHIYAALDEARLHIEQPHQTLLVLISDFYEGGDNQKLYDQIKNIKDSGTHFIPVGPLTRSGFFSVNQWFRDRLKELGTPILTGSPQKLITQLKRHITL